MLIQAPDRSGKVVPLDTAASDASASSISGLEDDDYQDDMPRRTQSAPAAVLQLQQHGRVDSDAPSARKSNDSVVDVLPSLADDSCALKFATT